VRKVFCGRGVAAKTKEALLLRYRFRIPLLLWDVFEAGSFLSAFFVDNATLPPKATPSNSTF
jgi:hypothetical protein